jgi:hypothetical protein
MMPSWAAASRRKAVATASMKPRGSGALVTDSDSSDDLHGPALPIDDDQLAVPQQCCAYAGRNDCGDAAFAGVDCRVGQDSAGVGDQCTDMGNSTVQTGRITGHTRTSPARSRSNSASEWMTRTVPAYRPGEAAMPWSVRVLVGTC